MQQKTSVLIIEDEPGIALTLYKALGRSAYRVDTAKTGSSGLRKAANKQFDIVLLDLGLPDMSGLTICRQLRSNGLEAPIIVLTGESDTKSKVTLLDAGANDYVTKPFSIDELQARIRAALRKPAADAPQPELITSKLHLHPSNRTVVREQRTVPLRRKEFALLEYLMKHAGSAVSRASLMSYVWDGNEDTWTNTIDVHIKHLRDKVDRPFPQQLIKTVHGIGYKLDDTSVVAK